MYINSPHSLSFSSLDPSAFIIQFLCLECHRITNRKKKERVSEWVRVRWQHKGGHQFLKAMLYISFILLKIKLNLCDTHGMWLCLWINVFLYSFLTWDCRYAVQQRDINEEELYGIKNYQWRHWAIHQHDYFWLRGDKNLLISSTKKLH